MILEFNYTEQAKELIRYFAGHGVDYYEIINKETATVEDVVTDVELAEQRVLELYDKGEDYCYRKVNN